MKMKLQTLEGLMTMKTLTSNATGHGQRSTQGCKKEW